MDDGGVYVGQNIRNKEQCGLLLRGCESLLLNDILQGILGKLDPLRDVQCLNRLELGSNDQDSRNGLSPVDRRQDQGGELL